MAKLVLAPHEDFGVFHVSRLFRFTDNRGFFSSPLVRYSTAGFHVVVCCRVRIVGKIGLISFKRVLSGHLTILDSQVRLVQL